MKNKYYNELQGNLLEYCMQQETKAESKAASQGTKTNSVLQEAESEPEQQITKRRLTPQEKVQIGIIPKNYQVKVTDVFNESTREDLRKAGYSDLEII